MKTPVLLFWLPVLLIAGCTSVSKEMEIRYDEVSGSTLVISSEVITEVENAGANSWKNSSVGNERTLGSLTFTANASCEGHTLSLPKSVILAFSAVNKEWTFLKSCSLVLTIDDEKVDLGSCGREAKTSVASGPVQCLEVLTKSVDFAMLKRIAYSKTTDGLLGETAFFSEYGSRAPLRDFVERLEGKTQKP